MKKIDLSHAIKALKDGDVIVYPTDTQYALGADIYNEDAIKKIFTIKKRPYSIPLPVAVANVEEIDHVAYTNNVIKQIVERFLPGPLTLILRKKDSVSNIITSGLDNIAVRIPNNDIALDLLSQCGPLTVTSANIHSEKTLHVINGIKIKFCTNISIYLDCGKLDAKPSTIVDLTTKKPTIVRRGPIKEEEILEAVKHG